MNNIEFILQLHPNGINPYTHNYVQLSFITSDPFPNDIKSFHIYLSLFCQEIKYEGRHTKSIKSSLERTRWPQWVMPLDNIKKIKDNLKYIDFGCYVEILYIKYKDNINKIDYIRDISLQIIYLRNIFC